ncbi:MAG: poly(R)-hydroxyalkanoic acid synthase subunit PhaE, partial [Dokdonella sp.]
YMDALKQTSSGQAAANPFGNVWPGPTVSNPFMPVANPFAGMANPFAAAPVNPFEAMTRAFTAGDKNDGSSSNDVAERMASSMKNYFAMLQAMATAGMPVQASESDGDSNPWLDAMKGAATHGADNPLFAAFRDFGGNGARGFEQMANQFMSSPAMADARAMLQLPTFGMSRERQEEVQNGFLVLMDFQEKSKAYQAQMARAAQRGNQIFQARLANRNESDKMIDTPRAFYDFWVDAAEEGYAEVALSPDFSQAYGDYANAQMSLRQHMQRETERTTGELGMPTRSEVNSIGKRLQELRREFRAANEAGTVAELQNEIASLRAEVKALRVGEAASDAQAQPALKAEPSLGNSLRTETPHARKSAAKRASKRTPKSAHRSKTASKKAAPAKKAQARDAGDAKPASFAASIARFAEAAKTATKAESKSTRSTKKSKKATRKSAAKS